MRQLHAIYAYIAQTSPDYARRTVDRLTNRSKQISAFPHSGRMVPEYEDENIREVLEASYRIIYVIYSEQIDVLAVIHEAQSY